jgi:hypothetical protein
MTPHDLLRINVNEHTEKKNNLTYLSWAWAWAEALKADPQANFNVQMFGDKPYIEINGTAMVWVTVTMFGKPMTCFLPVMNGGNKPISIEGKTLQTRNGPVVEKIDSFNVNTALMRCLTKCLALHGLGLYIYANEDLPMDEEPEAKPEAKVVKRKELPPEEVPKKEDMRLFADSMIQYTSICDSVDHLNSYWKANQGQLDILNSVYPDMYEEVLTKFKQLKASFVEKASE